MTLAPGYYWYYPESTARLARGGVQIVRVETGYDVAGEHHNYLLICGQAYGYREQDCPGRFVGPLTPQAAGEVPHVPAAG
jgi:hypothetical protein